MRVHALVPDLATAERAVEGGATVVQLRLKDAPPSEVVRTGARIRELCSRAGVAFVVNDDVEAATLLHADAVHLGQGDPGLEQAQSAGLSVGLSVSSVDETRAAVGREPLYLGAGPVWATPSKPEAAEPIGLEGLAAICRSVDLPVVAIGGIDAANAADCIRAGGSGVAVIRAVAELRELRAAVDGALAHA